MKKLFSITIIVFLLTLALTSIALAGDTPEPQPVGGCPNANWKLKWFGDIMAREDPWAAYLRSIDKNGDEFLCLKTGTKDMEPVKYFIDNKYILVVSQ